MRFVTSVVGQLARQGLRLGSTTRMLAPSANLFQVRNAHNVTVEEDVRKMSAEELKKRIEELEHHHGPKAGDASNMSLEELEKHEYERSGQYVADMSIWGKMFVFLPISVPILIFLWMKKRGRAKRQKRKAELIARGHEYELEHAAAHKKH